jgi:hypothetical protein
MEASDVVIEDGLNPSSEDSVASISRYLLIVF